MSSQDYLEVNRSWWDSITQSHIDSSFYDIERFEESRNSLKRPELDMIGDLKGKSLLHLQCHFGQDTLSLAELGADVHGVDLSGKAIEFAKSWSEKLNYKASFTESDLFSLPNKGLPKFDRVFTSYGTVFWMPETKKWAEVIAHHMKVGAEFIMVDFHPFVWMFDGGINNILYSYFNTGPIEETEEGSYADRDSGIRGKNIGWNHSMSDIIQALINAGLEIREFREYDYSPYEVFDNMNPTADGNGYQLSGKEGIMPLLFSIKAIKSS